MEREWFDSPSHVAHYTLANTAALTQSGPRTLLCITVLLINFPNWQQNPENNQHFKALKIL